jgi:UDP-GlcNAc:undecaprenyl-phosphate GlcNAc-1-phosphate transferase
MTAQASISVILAFSLAAGLVPALNGPARRVGLVDHPCHRKRHEGQIPLTGGLAMFLAFAAVMTLQSTWLMSLLPLIVGMAILLSVGLVDDLVDLRALHKLLAQILVACLVVVTTGLELNQLGRLLGNQFGPIGLGPFSELFTIACIAFLINAINMSDGLDGLAGGLCMVLLLMLGVLGWLDGAAVGLVVACFALAMAVLGFLLYNMQSPFRSKASVFMGDAGSMMLGFAIAWLAIKLTISEGSSIYPISIVWILFIPALDTLAVSIRRISQGRSPMAADRAHLHHIIQRCGFSVRETVGLMHVSAMICGLIGVMGWYLKLPEALLFGAAAGIMLSYMLLLINAHRIMRWRLRRLRRN